MKNTEYTIVDHLVTTGVMVDPVKALADEIGMRRSFGEGYLRFKLAHYRPFKRLWTEDGLHGYNSGLEEDKERMQIDQAQCHVDEHSQPRSVLEGRPGVEGEGWRKYFMMQDQFKVEYKKEKE